MITINKIEFITKNIKLYFKIIILDFLKTVRLRLMK